MAKTRDRLVRKFFLAAQQRFLTAELLLGLKRNLDATYLAGYSVECAIKALLLARTPQRKRDELMEQAFRGRRGHDYIVLMALVRATGCMVPIPVMAHFRVLTTWTTDLRYEVRTFASKDADRFLKSAKGIMDWVERSL